MDNNQKKAITNFASKFIDEVIPRFLKSGYRAEYYTITANYQADISDDLRRALIEVLLLNVNYEDIEEAINNNKNCSLDAIAQVYICSSTEIRILLIRTPKGVD